MRPVFKGVKVSGLVALLGVAILTCGRPLPVQAEILEIPGTGACEVLLQGVARAFQDKYPEHQVLVPPSIGSSGGIRAVRDHQAVLARVAQPLKGAEKTYGLKYLEFARDMVIFAVGARVTVKNLTGAQLLEVYAGQIANWQDLGGASGPIRLLARQPGDSSLRVIEAHLPAFRQISFPRGAKVTHTDPMMLQMLQKYRYSLGWLTFSALKGAQSPIYPLALDGVAPTVTNARSGKYKLLGPYALVFKEARLNALARLFLEFLFSPEGRQVMKEYGVIPVEKE